MIVEEDYPIWTPSERAFTESHMAHFLQRYAPAGTETYDELYRWSLNSPDFFWSAVAEYCCVQFTVPPEKVFQPGARMQDAVWFHGASLNYAENLLSGVSDQEVLVSVDERGRRRTLTRGQLTDEVAAISAVLREEGVQPGDRVAAVLPNSEEAVIAMLAAASIGAVFSSCSPDFGEQAIADRFRQIEPKVLFVSDGYFYAGKRYECLEKFERLANELDSLKRIFVVPYLNDGPQPRRLSSAILLNGYEFRGRKPDYASLPFDHPLFILYSSGTTGKPKCIVHSAGGTLLQHKKELMLHGDLRPDETIFYYTNCGWMMWNWLVSALSTGAKLILYDGSPMHPEAGSLIHVAEKEKTSILGTSPRYLTALQKSGEMKSSGWRELRTVLSTGAPLQDESFDFVKEQFGAHVQLSSISGGTDLISCFALGNPMLPVYRGELQCRGLGMAVEVFDADGNSLDQQPGELVCTRPFPSMPLGFWNDNDGRYEAAYFKKYPGVWAHGDMAELTEHGGLKIFGRSDAVLNPGGVRIGSTEVCAPAMTIDAVSDAIAVAHCKDGEDRVVLFVVLKNDGSLDADLKQQIRAAIRQQASPRHVPAKILEVPDIPRTMSGKPVELAVKAVIHGRPVENLAALANPEALEYFRGRL